jgi:AbrB family looped-hinge helix DNA binding protein
MKIAESRLTAQGQVSVPAAVRRQLGLGAGAVLDWEEEDGRIVVRRAGRRTSADIHRILFPTSAPAPRSLAALKAGIAHRMRVRDARR